MWKDLENYLQWVTNEFNQYHQVRVHSATSVPLR